MIFFKLNNFSARKNSGFTLIEIMVAITIFAIVAIVVTGTLVALSASNRKIQNIKKAVDNLNFTLNSMAVRIREGTGGDLDDNNFTGCQDNLIFSDYNGNETHYELLDRQIHKDLGDGLVPLTDRDIAIKDLQFCSMEQVGCDFNPETASTACKRTITIYLVGVINQDLSSETAFKLQTTVAQRNKLPTY